MLDPYVRPYCVFFLDRIAALLLNTGISAHFVTFLGFFFGILAIVCVAYQLLYQALFLLCLNRVCDGLDGAVARQKGLTDFGGILDILCDFIVYSGFVCGFAFYSASYALFSAVLLFSFVGTMVSFLGFAILAAKSNLSTLRCGPKAFYYLGGLCEGTETFLFFLIFCLFPEKFTFLALIFSMLCWMTTGARFYQMWVVFGKNAYTQGVSAIKVPDPLTPKKQKVF